MLIKDLALMDVRCVVRGVAADGYTPLAAPLSFSRDDAVLESAAKLLGDLYELISRAWPLTTDMTAQRTALTFKLLAHLSKTERPTPTSIAGCRSDIRAIAHVFTQQPHLIMAPVNFGGILRRHRLMTHEDARRHWRFPSFADVPPPRPVVWTSTDGRHCLHELIHPHHLIVESAVLSHCVGSPQHRYIPDTTVDLAKLPYWRLIASGQSRIFSFAVDLLPLCTLHIALVPPVLADAGGDPAVRKGTCYTPPFLAALGFLAAMFPGLSADTTLGLSPLGKHLGGVLTAFDAERRLPKEP